MVKKNHRRSQMKEHCYCVGFLYKFLIHIGNFLSPFLLLFLRVFWGVLFFYAGWEKVTDLSKAVEFFTQLHIPYPALNAYLVAFFETVGGLALIFGFVTRFFALALTVIMGVAIGLTNQEQLFNILSNPNGLIHDAPPFTFLIATLTIFCFGPGLFSIDYLVEKFRCHNRCE